MKQFFYTNVFARGDKIYVRGYEDNKRFSKVVNYKPYLFVDATKESKTPYRDINNKPTDKISFESIRDARDFTKLYQNVSNFNIYGLTNYQYVYIYDTYRDVINYEPQQINVISLDIETDTGSKYNAIPDKKVKIRKK